MATNFKKQTDPPTDFSGIDDPKLFLVGVASMLLGSILFISTITDSIPF